MEELAARAVGAVELLVVALALLGLVIAWHVGPLFKLVGTMGKRARLSVLAGAVKLPEFADLSLKLHLEALIGDNLNLFLCFFGCVSSSLNVLLSRVFRGLLSCLGHILQELLWGWGLQTREAAIFPVLGLLLVLEVLFHLWFLLSALRTLIRAAQFLLVCFNRRNRAFLHTLQSCWVVKRAILDRLVLESSHRVVD